MIDLILYMCFPVIYTLALCVLLILIGNNIKPSEYEDVELSTEVSQT